MGWEFDLFKGARIGSQDECGKALDQPGANVNYQTVWNSFSISYSWPFFFLLNFFLSFSFIFSFCAFWKLESKSPFLACKQPFFDLFRRSFINLDLLILSLCC